MKLFGVTGHPILHSRSPQIFARLFSAGGLDAIYTRVGARAAGDALSLARRMGISGLNVTAPFKQDICEMASARDDWATRLGATNTVVIEPDAVRAFNTDLAGVRRALAVRAIAVRGSRVVVLGTGGAARAAVAALIADGADVVVTSRTAGHAAEVAGRLGCRWAELESLPALLASAAGMVSCLSEGADPVDETLLRAPLWILDANYVRSPLAEKARRRGCAVVSGIDWLIGQAMASYGVFAGAARAPAGLSDAPLEAAAADARRLITVSDEGQPRRGLALSGMMGAGKTSAGREIARRLDREFIDIDELVVERTGRDIRSLFEHRSENEFRRVEADLVTSAIDGRPSVIALGGGSLENETTRDHVRRHCRVVWLWASPSRLAARTAAESSSRPLLDGQDPVARLAELLAARVRTYATAADLVVDAERPIEDVASLVEFEVRRIED